ncbi:hypothetical protein [Halalkalibacter urbisdiaboli]|uniref:hypothetical protein n=1 Tax=Halalkalibacter urbisdiaboli TaxID=1960589 RepID=UPI000B42D27D|nr:hypothetical protein [Halalkalibacter urbisdiaboli]
MLHSQIQHQNIRKSEWQSVRSLSFSQGQVFKGRITKLYPNNLASLTVRGMAITARLEAALTAGQSYWFEVEESSGIPRLKVLADNRLQNREGSPSQEMLKQLGLPQTKAMEALIKQFSSEQIPFTKDTIFSAAQLLTKLNRFDKETLLLLQGMIQRQIPLTRETFLAFQATQQQGPFSEQLFQLVSEANQFNQPGAKQLGEVVNQFLTASQLPSTRSPISELIMMFSSNGFPQQVREGAHTLLERLGIIEEGVSKEQIYTQFREALLRPENRILIEQLWPDLGGGRQGLDITSFDKKTLFELFMSRLTIPAGKEANASLKLLIQLFQPNLTIERVQQNWNQLLNQSLPATERLALQQALESTFTQQTPGRPLTNHFQNVLQLLGYQHESEMITLLQGDVREGEQSERLKASLLAMQQEELPSGLKDKLNQLINRITGQQLLAQEQAGPLQHIVLQVPLSFGAFKTDMTMHWEGKKTKDGKLDPNHCRILFYLTLEGLEETIVDVQIHNRVMAVTIFNERERPEGLIQLLLPSLKKSLANHDYQLLSLSWKEMKEVNAPQSKAKEAYQQQVGYQGVDVRI